MTMGSLPTSTAADTALHSLVKLLASPSPAYASSSFAVPTPPSSYSPAAAEPASADEPVDAGWAVSLPPFLVALKETEETLARILISSFEALALEPAILASRLGEISDRLAHLAYAEYPTFLQCAALMDDFDSSFSSLDAQLSAISNDAIPALSTTSSALQGTLNSAFINRDDALAIVEHVSPILDTLEIPKLIDALRNNGHFEEAMDLHAHVQKLALRYPNMPLLKDVTAQVNALTKGFLAQLLQLLQTNSALPFCIRVIGFLRRMDFLSETELRLIFLRERDVHLQEFVSKLQHDNLPSDEYLKRYLEGFRECVFDTITQYKAIFHDSISGASAFSSQSGDLWTADEFVTSHILSSYTSRSIETLLSELDVHLARISDTGIISSLLTTSLYIGLSLGRVGLDFRDLIARKFERRVYDIVRLDIEGGMGIVTKHIITNGLTMTPTNKSVSSVSLFTTAKGLQPAQALLACPPLAWSINIFYAACNLLRQTPFIGIYEPLMELISMKLQHLLSIVHDESARRLLEEVLIPSVAVAFEGTLYAKLGKTTFSEKISKMLKPQI